MGDERLRIPKVVGNIDEAQRIEKTETGSFVAGHIEADEAAALFHLPARKLELRMARQAGVEDARDLWMALQITGNRSGGAALPLDPQFQGFKALQQKPCVEWAQGWPGVAVKGTEIVLDEFLRGDDRAAETASLAIDVLGRRIDDDIRAQYQWLLQERRREHIVHDEDAAGAVGQARDLGKIDDLHRRVRRALAKRQ